jgi:hypothetical protein
MLKRTLCSTLLSTLKQTKADLNTCCITISDTYCRYETTTVSSFGGLHHLTETCILKATCHRIYTVQYFLLVFEHGITLWRARAQISLQAVQQELLTALLN